MNRLLHSVTFTNSICNYVLLNCSKFNLIKKPLNKVIQEQVNLALYPHMVSLDFSSGHQQQFGTALVPVFRSRRHSCPKGTSRRLSFETTTDQTTAVLLCFFKEQIVPRPTISKFSVNFETVLEPGFGFLMFVLVPEGLCSQVHQERVVDQLLSCL